MPGRLLGFRRWLAVAPKQLVLALALSGCFEVHEVDTDGTPILWPVVRKIDDFETPFPTWVAVNTWGCGAWPDEPEQTFDCGRTENAQFLSFDLTRPSVEIALGAELGFTVGNELDLSRYDELVFRLKFEEIETDPLPDDFEVRVVLHCPGAGTGAASFVSTGGERLGLVSAIESPPADGTWRVFALRLADFIQPFWQKGSGGAGYDWERIDPSRCLTMIDGIGFQPATEAQHMAGSIWLDDVELHDFAVEGAVLASGMRFAPWWCESPAWANERVACDTNKHAPEVTLSPFQPGSLCIQPERVNDLEIHDDQRDIAGFERLSFGASFVPLTGSSLSGRRFTARLWCGGLSSDISDPPSLVREVVIVPGWSTYALPLTSFTRAEQPLGPIDPTECLSEVDKICFEAEGTEGEEAAGTLRVEDLLLN
jgi:hypothetical protein